MRSGAYRAADAESGLDRLTVKEPTPAAHPPGKEPAVAGADVPARMRRHGTQLMVFCAMFERSLSTPVEV